MKQTRATLRGHKLDSDCKRAKTTTHEYGLNDNRVFCFGLYEGDYITLDKCKNCKAFIDNITPLRREKKDE